MFLNQEIYGSEAEIQLPFLKEVSRFQRLFPNLQLVNARQDGHLVSKNLLQYPWIDSCLMVTSPLVVTLTLVKCHQRMVIYPDANIPNPSLAWKKANIFSPNVQQD